MAKYNPNDIWNEFIGLDPNQAAGATPSNESIAAGMRTGFEAQLRPEDIPHTPAVQKFMDEHEGMTPQQYLDRYYSDMYGTGPSDSPEGEHGYGIGMPSIGHAEQVRGQQLLEDAQTEEATATEEDNGESFGYIGGPGDPSRGPSSEAAAAAGGGGPPTPPPTPDTAAVAGGEELPAAEAIAASGGDIYANSVPGGAALGGLMRGDVGGVAGGAIGAYFGGTVGASIGATIGSSVQDMINSGQGGQSGIVGYSGASAAPTVNGGTAGTLDDPIGILKLCEKHLRSMAQDGVKTIAPLGSSVMGTA